MRITLDNVKGKILKTAKTVIRKDIEVVPKLENVEITANGIRKVSEGYSGIGEVLVNVQSGGSGSWAGVFDDDKVYYVGAIVYYDGGIYERTKYSQMIQLPTNAEYWSLLAEVVSGSKAIHTNGPHDVTQYKKIHVAVPDENNWEGEYEDGIAYKYGALVVYNVGVYLALKDTDGTQNPTNEEYWEKLTPLWNDTTDATATEDKIIAGETAYVNGKKVTGTMPSAAENEATITVESASEGSVDIKYLQMFNTYLPAGETKIGTVAEANLVPSKIKKDETIFGVTGEYEGEGGTDTSDATVTAEEVIKGEVFYGADGRKTGTMPSVMDSNPTLTLEGDGNGNVDIKHLQMINTYIPYGEHKIGTVAVENLSASKIKKDETILGVKGEYEGVAIAEWNGNSAYEPNAIVIFDKVYYVCIKATTAGSVVNNPSVTPSEWKRLNGAYKGEYNSSATYYLGDIVLSNNNLYQSKIDNPETTPDNDMASRWTLLHEAEDTARPIEVSTEAEMTALLTSGEVGGVYKYVGTSGTYENGALYVLEEETASYTVKIAALGDGNVSSYKMNGNNSVDLEIHYAIRSADQATQEIMEQYATTLTDVSSLVCYLEGDDTDNCVVVYDSNFNQVHSEYNNFAEVDVTSYLSEGCYVLICTNS